MNAKQRRDRRHKRRMQLGSLLRRQAKEHNRGEVLRQMAPPRRIDQWLESCQRDRTHTGPNGERYHLPSPRWRRFDDPFYDRHDDTPSFHGRMDD